MRDIITSIQSNHGCSNAGRIRIIFIPTSPIELFNNKKPIRFINELIKKDNFGNLSQSEYLLELELKNLIIEIQIFKLSISELIKFSILSILKSLIIWLKYFIFQFNIISFLNTKFEKIQIGDIASSIVFRNKSLFRLNYDFELVKETFRLTILVQILNYIGNKGPNTNNYFSVLDFTYTEALLLRVLPYYKFKYVETQDYQYENIIIENLKLYYYPWIARFKINDHDLDLYEKYYNSRLFEPNKVLDYMWMGTNNNNNKDIILGNGEPFVSNGDDQYVVLYLHAFSDAAYCYGLDGYRDLLDWVISTIDILINNSSIDKILLKPHPNVSFDYYPADQKAMSYLVNMYSANLKVLFLQKDCSLVALCSLEKIIGITRHGSVAEEMVFLNKPVIAFKNGPWFNYHEFLITWENKTVYENILSNLNFEEIKNLPFINKKQLLNYCLEYRINSRNISKGWYDILFKLCSSDEFIGNFENISKLDFLIKVKKLDFTIEYLYRNNALNLN